MGSLTFALHFFYFRLLNSLDHPVLWRLIFKELSLFLSSVAWKQVWEISLTSQLKSPS